eukprot:scaffold13399_cov219-Skeletonema_menzelii.AAC.1
MLQRQKVLVRIVNNLKAKAVDASRQHVVQHNRNGKDQIITSEMPIIVNSEIDIRNQKYYVGNIGDKFTQQSTAQAFLMDSNRTMKIVNVECEHVHIVEKLLRQEKLEQIISTTSMIKRSNAPIRMKMKLVQGLHRIRLSQVFFPRGQARKYLEIRAKRKNEEKTLRSIFAILDQCDFDIFCAFEPFTWFARSKKGSGSRFAVSELLGTDVGLVGAISRSADRRASISSFSKKRMI